MFKLFSITTLLILLIPPTVSAATTGSLQSLLSSIGGFMNSVLVPFILGIAFLIFVINVVRFFIIGSHDTEGQKNARYLAIYSVAAFVFILSFWGIVNLLIGGIGLNTDPCYPTSDYLPGDGTSCPEPVVVTPITPIAPDPDAPVNPITPITPINPITPIDPLSPLPDPDGADFRPVLAAEDTVRTAAAPYLNTDMQLDFGNNTDTVKDILLADIPTAHTNAISPLERSRAMYRLIELGRVPAVMLTDYLSALGTYYTDLGLGQVPPTMTDIQSAVVSLPVEVIQSQNETRQLILDQLSIVTSPSRAPGLVADLYNTSIDPDTRFDNLLDMHFSNHWVNLELVEKFRNDINAEKIFAADFFLAQ